MIVIIIIVVGVVVVFVFVIVIIVFVVVVAHQSVGHGVLLQVVEVHKVGVVAGGVEHTRLGLQCKQETLGGT